jgi:hypothetical protein
MEKIANQYFQWRSYETVFNNPKLQQVNLSDLSEKNGRFKIF